MSKIYQYWPHIFPEISRSRQNFPGISLLHDFFLYYTPNKHAGSGIVQRLENMNRPGREFSFLREQLRAHASFSVNDVVMLQIFTKFVRNPPNGCFVSSKNIRNIFNYTEYVRFIVFLTRGLAQKSRIWRESL